MFDLRLKQPASCVVAGPSQSGKTSFVGNILRYKHVLFENNIRNVVYFYNQWQPAFEKFQDEGLVTEWIGALPTTDLVLEKTELFKHTNGSIIIIDDFAQNVNRDIAEIFTVLCHHTNSFVLLLAQNIFGKQPVWREISLNSTYITLFKNPRDATQISHFAKQFSPTNSRYVVDSFRECTIQPYTYMVFDLHQSTNDLTRVRSNIFPIDGPLRVWIPRK